jgi:outer membrane receptor for ferrienterochelin and colicins
VFGASIVAEKMAELEAQGLVQAVYMDPATIGEIKSESSLAYNLGFVLTPYKRSTLKINLFRNDINDLIETVTIALKTNGQSVFSYTNYAKVMTQGAEIQLDYRITKGLTFSSGYQYLDTRDQEAWDDIEAGKVYRRDPATNLTQRMKTSDYGGLFNRSRHSGNAKLFYENTQHAFNASLRAIYRGRWGYGDINGNSVLDTDQEYADAYWLWNFSVNKRLWKKVTLEAGVNNIFDQKNTYETTLSGRGWYGGISVAIGK